MSINKRCNTKYDTPHVKRRIEEHGGGRRCKYLCIVIKVLLIEGATNMLLDQHICVSIACMHLDLL